MARNHGSRLGFRYPSPSLLRIHQAAGRGCSGSALSRTYKTGPSHIHACEATASHIMSESDNTSTETSPYPALDESLYDPTDEESSFFKQQTGIQDDEELKAHIIQVQSEAYKVCNREPRESQCGNSRLICLKTGFSVPLHPLVRFRKVSPEKKGTRKQLKWDIRLRMWHLSPYQDLLKRGKSYKGAIFLDIGSCGEQPVHSPKVCSHL